MKSLSLSKRSPRKSVRSPSKFNSPLKKGQKLVTDFFAVTAVSPSRRVCLKNKNGIPLMFDQLERRRQNSVNGRTSSAGFEPDSDVEFIEEVTCSAGSSVHDDGGCLAREKREVLSPDQSRHCQIFGEVSEAKASADNQDGTANSTNRGSTFMDCKLDVNSTASHPVLKFGEEPYCAPNKDSGAESSSLTGCQKQENTPSLTSSPRIFLKSVADINETLAANSADSKSSSPSSLGMVIDDVYTLSKSQQSDIHSCGSISIKEDPLPSETPLQSSESQKSEYSLSDPLEKGSQPETPLPYYLVSFNHILATVLADRTSRGLFDEADKSVLASWSQLSLPAQFLCLRLLQRKNKWQRSGALQYTEIVDSVEVLIDELVTSKMAAKSFDDVDSALSVLDIGECRVLCQKLHVSHRGSRATLLSRIHQYSSRQTTLSGALSPGAVLLQHARSLAGPCVRLLPDVRRLLRRVIMLYHTPQYDDMEDLTQILWTLSLVRSGTLRFPSAPVLRETVLFPSRSCLLRYERASELETELRRCMENKLWSDAFAVFQQADLMFEELASDEKICEHDASLPFFLRKFSAMSILCYVRHCGVELYQRRRDFTNAVKLLRSLISQTSYLLSYRGHWYDRLTLNLHQHLRQQEEAAAALSAAFRDPWVRGGPRLSLLQRAARLGVAPTNTEIPTASSLPTIHLSAYIVSAAPRLYLLEDRGGGEERLVSASVEDLVLQRLCGRGAAFTAGSHCEGGMVRMLFVLIFWDIIYDQPIADAFRCDVQAAPLDLNHDSFYNTRRAAVDARLQRLNCETIRSLVEDHWTAQYECQCFARWDVFKDVGQALELAECMGAELIKAICHRLFTSFRFTRSGFPDLTLWNPQSGTCRFVEVKGPNDRLSSKQILWIDFINKNGGSAQTCHVTTVSARRKRGLEGGLGEGCKEVSSEGEEGEGAEMSVGTVISRRKRGMEASKEVGAEGEGGIVEEESVGTVTTRKRSGMEGDLVEGSKEIDPDHEKGIEAEKSVNTVTTRRRKGLCERHIERGRGMGPDLEEGTGGERPGGYQGTGTLRRTTRRTNHAIDNMRLEDNDLNDFVI